MRNWMMTLAMVGAVGCGDATIEDTDCPDGTHREGEDCVEDCEASTWYLDTDGDGFGDDDSTIEACERSPGTVDAGGDCNDWNPLVFPGADETCNEVDDDCDGAVDEEPVDGDTWYPDADGDGWGDDDGAYEGCLLDSGHVESGGDCDDTDDRVSPDADEVCNDRDDDCSGLVDDEPVDGDLWYPDADGDGYGGEATAERFCEDPGEGWGAADGDCDDSREWVNPSNDSDACDGIDDDCDGATDEDDRSCWDLITVHKDGYIHEIDPDTAEMTQRAYTGTPNVSSADVRADGTGFMVDGTSLYTFSGCTGAWATVGDHGLEQTGSLAFDQHGTLYGLDSYNDELVSYDTATGLPSTVGSLGVNIGFNGFAYDRETSTMYAVDKDSSELFQVDLLTGLASDFLPLDLSFGVVGMEFDPVGGVIWLSTGGTLWEVEPSTGAATEVGSFDIGSVNDLSLVPPCP